MSIPCKLPKGVRRVFFCGCVEDDDAEPHIVTFPPSYNYVAVCPIHGERFKELEITCSKCKRTVRRPKAAMRSKYCDDCFQRVYKKGKYRPQRPPAQTLSAYDKEVIESHPWQSSTQLAKELGKNRHIVREYQRKVGIESKHPALAGEYAIAEWFDEHRHVAHGGGAVR